MSITMQIRWLAFLPLLLLCLALSPSLTGAVKCFFSKRTCADYCCVDDDPFNEYCCNDCTKSAHANMCFSGVAVNIVIAVVVIAGFAGVGVLVLLCALGCICNKLTGRPPFGQTRPTRQQQQQQQQTGLVPTAPPPHFPAVHQEGGFPSAPMLAPQYSAQPPPYPAPVSGTVLGYA